MPELETLLREYGYAFLFLGSLLEGETTVALSGFAAHRGYMNLPAVIVVAGIGAAAGSQIWFHVGRIRGKAFLERRADWEPHVARFEALLDRWDVAVIFGFRFLYGIRMIGAAAIGASDISTLKFTLLNLIGAGAWAILVAGGGFYLGKAMEKVLSDMASYELWGFLALALAGLGLLVWRMRRRR